MTHIKLFESWINEAETNEENVQAMITKISPLIRASASDRAEIEYQFRKKLSSVKNSAEKESIKRQFSQEKELVSKPWKDVLIKDESLTQTQSEKISAWAEAIEEALYTKQMYLMKNQFSSAELDIENWDTLYDQREAQKSINSHNLMISKELNIKQPTTITQ